jgi:serine/threonine protein kinase
VMGDDPNLDSPARLQPGSSGDGAGRANRRARRRDNVGPPTTLYQPTELPGDPAEIFAIGAIVGTYRLIKEVGRGGMGTVFLAEDTRLGRQVAIKAPLLVNEDVARALARFQQEAHTAAALHHPNLCPIYEAGVVQGRPYMAMAFIDGKPLTQILKSGKRLPIATALTLVRKIALAVDEVHKAGIIHRDLKPSNVMITKDSEPVVMDFGLALRTDREHSQITKSGFVVGTPTYMSPEQLANRREEVGPASDVYSLGAILYEILTLRPPFEGDVLTLASKIALEEPQRPSSMRPEIDSLLDGICLKALAKEPGDRFAGMREFALRITEYLKRQGKKAARGKQDDRVTPPSGPAVVTPKPSKSTRISMKAKRPNWSLGIVLIGIALVFVLGSALTSSSGTGTIVIQSNGADVELRLTKTGQSPRVIQAASGQSVSLPVGDYQAELVSPTQTHVLDQGSFEVRSGKMVELHISAQ